MVYQFILRTKEIEQYFQGKIIYNTIFGQNIYQIECLSLAGNDISDVMDLEHKQEGKLLDKVREFAKQRNLTFLLQ